MENSRERDPAGRREDDMTDRAKMIWTLAITSVAVFMVSLDNLVVTTALPVIKRSLGASLASLGTTPALRMTGCGHPSMRW